MIDLKLLKENNRDIERRLRKRREDINLENILKLDDERRKLIKEVDDLRKERRSISKGPEAREKGKELKSRIQELEKVLKEVEERLKKELLNIPNIPSDSVPDEMKIVKVEGEIKEYDFKVLPHWEIGRILNIFDFEKASKLSGARFPLLKGYGVKLEMALLNFFLEENRESGYKEIITPYLVKEDVMIGTGQLPKFEIELYKCERDNLYLIPTAEVTLGNLLRNEILEEDELPVKIQSFSPCFRREAGSYGKETKGLIRNHQFHKVELFKFTKPEESDGEFLSLVEDAENLLKKLELPYRVVELPADELAFSSGRTFDLEVWMPGGKRWLEVSSCSNCYDFQARRTNTRLRRKDGKIEFVHTINGSGLALGRTMAAILENYQNEDGTVRVPEVLKKYMDCDIIKRK
ncbi:MAG: serine--tRNA ligase [Caldiserica bacterium]|nr:MAG: serine--tRNA ligase [Caldisericota bacterium]